MTPFDLERIRRETFVRQVEYLDEAPSTNTLATSLAESERCETPLLVLAARQTAGRGRGANRWWSSEGALTFSLALDASAAQLPPARRPLVSLAAGLAVCAALEELLPGRELGVKWPNDVHLKGRKVCGILVESACRGERFVIGVGINVNNPLAEAPEEIAARATSLCEAAGAAWPLSEVLTRVLSHLDREWQALLMADAGQIERLRERCVLTGRNIAVDAGQERIAGLCQGVADDGALLLETLTGPRRLYAGVVAMMD